MTDNSTLVPFATPGREFGSAAGETLKALANSAASAFCGLYQAAPGYATGSNFNNPIADYNDGLLNSLCAPRNQLPAPKTTPFSGGQCVGRQYRVFQRVSQPPQPDAETSALVFAPVVGLITDRGTDGNGNPTKSYRLQAGINAQGAVGTYLVSGESSNPGFEIVITSVVPEDGLPDTCGNIAPRYPNDNPGSPLVSFPTTIQVSPTANITVPVNIFAPIRILAPSLRLGDVNVDINLGGLNFDFSPNVLPPGQPAPTKPQPQPQPGDSFKDRDDQSNNEEVLKYLRRLRECQECDEDFNFLTTTSANAVSGSISVPSGGIPVSIGFNITSQPSNPKKEPGLNQPDVLYAGWGWFDGNDFVGTRESIDSASKLFLAPSDPPVQKWRWTLRVGYTGTATMRYKVKKNPLPEL